MPEAGSAWLKATWGKFRNQQRSSPSGLSRPGMAGAWEMWRYMVSSSAEGNGADPERVRSFLAGLGEEQRAGAQTFAGWIKANATELQQAASRGAGDGAHTTDGVEVQLLR